MLSSSPQSPPTSLLTSLLEGSVERDGRERKISTVSLDSGCGQERVDPGAYWKGIGFYKTPSLTDGKTTPLTPSSSHFRQISDSSEVSFQLPSPSFAWAPPPSPSPSQFRLSLTSPSGTPPYRVGVSREGSLSSPEHCPSIERLENSDHTPSPEVERSGDFRLDDWDVLRTSVGVVKGELELLPDGGGEGLNRNGLFNRTSCSTPNLQTCWIFLVFISFSLSLSHRLSLLFILLSLSFSRFCFVCFITVSSSNSVSRISSLPLSTRSSSVWLTKIHKSSLLPSLALSRYLFI